MLAVAMAALDTVMRLYAVDTKRIYLLGQSMGGDGVFELASMHRDRFAAAIVAAVGWREPPFSAQRLRDMPLWVFHGTADRIPVQRARDRVERIRTAGSQRARLTELTGRGHDIFDEVYRDPAVPKWLFSYVR